jgi:hypothetical protein
MGEDSKRCPSCNSVKRLEDFGPDKQRLDGRRAICKKCRADHARHVRATQRANGEGPRPGKKARARKPVVVSLDDRRLPPGRDQKGKTRHGDLPTSRPWYPESPGPEVDTSWYARFLERLAVNRNVTEAAAHAGIHRQRVYDALARDKLFAEAFGWARDEARERVELVSWQRGVDGWDEDVYSKDGNIVGCRHVYDAAMLRLILQGVAPEYRRQAIAVQVNTQVNITDVRAKLTTKLSEYASRSG